MQGTNLQFANHVVLVEPAGFNAGDARSIETQAVGRVLRIGQDRRVTVTRFLLTNTIEMKLHESAQEKAISTAGPMHTSSLLTNLTTKSAWERHESGDNSAVYVVPRPVFNKFPGPPGPPAQPIVVPSSMPYPLSAVNGGEVEAAGGRSKDDDDDDDVVLLPSDHRAIKRVKPSGGPSWYTSPHHRTIRISSRQCTNRFFTPSQMYSLLQHFSFPNISRYFLCFLCSPLTFPFTQLTRLLPWQPDVFARACGNEQHANEQAYRPMPSGVEVAARRSRNRRSRCIQTWWHSIELTIDALVARVPK
jgi:hypothetical protein